MNMQDVADRLNDQIADLERRATVLRDITEVEDADLDVPVAFVLRVADAVDNYDGMSSVQRAAWSRRFAVLLMTRGAEGDDDPMEDLRQKVIAALQTWIVDDLQFEFTSGEARPPIAGMDRWQDTFRFTQYFRFAK